MNPSTTGPVGSTTAATAVRVLRLAAAVFAIALVIFPERTRQCSTARSPVPSLTPPGASCRGRRSRRSTSTPASRRRPSPTSEAPSTSATSSPASTTSRSSCRDSRTSCRRRRGSSRTPCAASTRSSRSQGSRKESKSCRPPSRSKPTAPTCTSPSPRRRSTNCRSSEAWGATTRA